MRLVEPPDPDLAPANNPVLAIDVDELAGAFEHNGLAAERRFGGQLVAVTGPVATVFRGKAALYVTMLGGEFGSLLCAFPEDAIDDLVELRRGDVLVIEGTVPAGRTMTVRLRECRIIEVRPAGRPGPRAA